MAIQLGSAYGKVGIDSSGVKSGLDSARSQLRNFSSDMKKVGKDIAGAGQSLTTGLTLPIVAGVGYLSNAGREIAGIRSGFENFTEQAGVSATDMLGKIKSASNGMISERDAMLAYNNAAGLVGETFANRLPDSMDIFAKVAAATGQDVNKVTSDYVTGVGRSSKMILDNLGITVDLEKANEDYAASLGKTVDELTDHEKKLALDAQAMALLEEKYAGMEGVADLPGASMQQFGATMQDLRDTFGTFFVEALNPFLKRIAELASEWLPRVKEALQSMSPGVKMGIMAFLGIAAAIGPVLLVLGNVITAVGAIVGVLSGPLIGVIAVVIGAVALLAAAWKNNWGGIQEKTALFWAYVKEAFTKLGVWLADKLPVAIAYLKNFWEQYLLPAFQAVGNFISTVLVPAFIWVASVVIGNLVPKLQMLWAFLKEYVFPALDAIAKLLLAAFSYAFNFISALIVNIVVPALKKFWSWLSEKLGPTIEKVGNWMRNTFTPAIKGVGDAIKGVIDWIGRMADKLSNLSLPKWLTPGSPTPWEIGLWGIKDALNAVGSTGLPRLKTGLDILPEPALGLAGAGGQGSAFGGSNVRQSVSIGNISVHVPGSNVSPRETARAAKNGVLDALKAKGSA